MPKNNKNFVAKEIEGKKIREQYFDGIVIGALIGIFIATTSLFIDLNNFVTICILIIVFSPFMLLAVLNRFLFGKILCVFTEDKLYYFDAEISKNSRHNKTNGYVEYNEIKKVEYIPSPFFGGRDRPARRLIISGEKFEITIYYANRSLVKEINKRR